MKRVAEYIAAVVFSVFFLLGGTGFTLSHYCCKQCRKTQCAINNQQLTNSIPDGDNCALCIMHCALSKRCACCWVRHFEVDTTETAPAFCLPDKAVNDLFGTGYPPYIHLISTLLLPNDTGYVYLPPLATDTDNAKGVLRRVCRWLI